MVLAVREGTFKSAATFLNSARLRGAARIIFLVAGEHHRWGSRPVLGAVMRQRFEVDCMAQLVTNVSGRGEFPFIDDSGQIFTILRTIVTNFPVIQADASFRRNPAWYTLGQLSISYASGTLLKEWWINYPDQIHYYVSDEGSQLQTVADQLDLPESLYSPGTQDIPLVLAWQMRGSAQLTVYIGS